MKLRNVLLGCLGVPALLVSSCAGKMALDHHLYVLPGRVLESDRTPTQKLQTPLQVAQTLDTYVQPRFEILRDKNFGAFRIVYRRHAGIVQLKVDSNREKELIANVNAAGRDYAISLLHCAPKPGYGAYKPEPKLQVLYYNRTPVAGELDFGWSDPEALKKAGSAGFDQDSLEKRAIAALPDLMAGKERFVSGSEWDLLMRPVLATKRECLSCHEEAKQGDTLGAMVYAVRKTARRELASR